MRYNGGQPIARRASLVREQQAQQHAEERERQQEQKRQKRQRITTPQRRRKVEAADHLHTQVEPSEQPTQPAQPERTARQGSRPSRPSQPTHPVQSARRQPPRAPRASQQPRPATVPPGRHAGTATRSTRTSRPLFTRKQVITGSGIAGLLLLLLIPLLLHIENIGASSGGSIVSTNSTQIPGTQVAGVGAQPTPGHNLVIKPQDLDHPPPPVNAASAYLLDANTGNTLYAYNAFAHLPMLSTTKLMTAVLAIEQQGNNLNQLITINDAMNRDISRLSSDSALFGIKKGEVYTLRDLMYGLLFVSGNDAAIAIADALGGNMQHFVDEMNTKARQLGMLDTHFVNPHGLLQNGQYSCAHDLALLGRFAMTIPELHTISGQKAYYIPAGGHHPVRYLINENQFLWWYPGVDGGKTGYDGQSDFIQVMSVTRGQQHLIGVVMHTINWWTDMRDLMNWGFDTFSWVSPRIVDAQHPIPYDDLWNYFAKDTTSTTVPTADKGRYYIYTGYSIDGPVMKYFDGHGGLKTFGYPTGMPKTTGTSQVNQQFQKAAIQCDLSRSVCQKV